MRTVTTTSLIFFYGVLLLVLSFVDNVVISSFLDSIENRQSQSIFYIFSTITCICIFGQVSIFYSIRKRNISFKIKLTRYARIFQIIIILSIGINIILFSSIISQLAYQKVYDTNFLKAVVYSSYFFSLINIGFLIQNFFSWFKKNRNFIMLLYCLAFSVYLINEICAILIVHLQLEGRPQKASFIASPWDSTSLRITSFSDFYKITSLVSFAFTWVATSLLMYHYSQKISKSKFWILASLPLIYYISNIDLIRSSIFTYLLTYSPDWLWVMQIFLGATKQVGGFFFALAFIILSRNVQNQKLKYYLVISATGMMLLYSSNQISLIQVIPYPPFGLNTISLVSISSFLILLGLYNLAYSMAHDKRLLDNVRQIVKERSSKFLYDIGSSQWQTDIDKTVDTLIQSRLIDNPESVPISLTREEIKIYVETVREEFRQTKRKSGRV